MLVKTTFSKQCLLPERDYRFQPKNGHNTKAQKFEQHEMFFALIKKKNISTQAIVRTLGKEDGLNKEEEKFRNDRYM